MAAAVQASICIFDRSGAPLSSWRSGANIALLSAGVFVILPESTNDEVTVLAAVAVPMLRPMAMSRLWGISEIASTEPPPMTLAAYRAAYENRATAVQRKN